MCSPCLPQCVCLVCAGTQEKKKEGVPTGDVEGASVEELNQKITTLEKEKNKEEEYRNYMQLERVRVAAGCMLLPCKPLLLASLSMAGTAQQHAQTIKLCPS